MTRLTQEQLLTGLFGFFDDLDFIEKVNDLTYSRKVQLKAKLKNSTLHTNKNHNANR